MHISISLAGNSVCTCHLYLFTFQEIYSWCLNVHRLISLAVLAIRFYCSTVWRNHFIFPPRYYLSSPLLPQPSLLQGSVGLICTSCDINVVHFTGLTAEWSGELDFSTLLSIMHQQLRQEAPEEEILEAMRMADKEQKGFILVSELRAKLTSLGEKLTDGEGESQQSDVVQLHLFISPSPASLSSGWAAEGGGCWCRWVGPLRAVCQGGDPTFLCQALISPTSAHLCVSVIWY